MILYKYVSFTAGRKILETETVGFTQPEHFNDPFDVPAYPQMERPSPEDMFGRIRVMAKEGIWRDNTGILSLTRTPINPLMWAHYADKHRGMVIGIDVIAAGFTREQGNLIPAQYGSVIYISGRPEQPFIGKPRTGLEVGTTHDFPHDHYEKLQRLFLHKPLCWAYEEEVRVVKCLNGVLLDGGETPSGKFNVIQVDGRPLHLFTLPRNALREVYFGFRLDIEEGDEFFYQMMERHPQLAIRGCYLQPHTYSVGFKKYTTVAQDAADYG